MSHGEGGQLATKKLKRNRSKKIAKSQPYVAFASPRLTTKIRDRRSGWFT